MLIEQNLNKIYMFYIESEKLAKDQILNLRDINENILLEDDFINFTELFIQSLHYEAD